jgi:hypothetical protein
MGYNPFETVASYGKMLAKIGVFTFANAVGAVWMLTFVVPPIGTFLAQWSLQVPLWGIKVPLGVLVVSLAWAFLSRLVKLHDRVSDVLGLRRRFDVEHILKPMAQEAGVQLSPILETKLRRKRRDLMSAVFYKYASGGTGKAVIDDHYVTMALDQWAWFWIVLEGVVTLSLAAIVLVFTENLLAAGIILLVVAGSCGLMVCSWGISVRYAQDEIHEITKDGVRKQDIAAVFNAL